MCVSARKKTKANEKERPRRDFNKSFENRRGDKNKNLAAEQTNKFGFFLLPPPPAPLRNISHLSEGTLCPAHVSHPRKKLTKNSTKKSQEKCIIKVSESELRNSRKWIGVRFSKPFLKDLFLLQSGSLGTLSVLFLMHLDDHFKVLHRQEVLRQTRIL